MSAGDHQERANTRMWSSPRRVRQYATTGLTPGEAAVLERFADAFSGRVLEIGCGGGRMTGHMAERSADVRAADISPAMVDYARSRYPSVTFLVADLRDLSVFPDADADVVALWDNLIDILGHEERAAALAELRRMLRPGGLLVLDAHNLAHAPFRRRPTDVPADSLRQAARSAAGVPVKLFNHLRLRRHEHAGPGYAVLNDETYHFVALHYYVDRAEQQRQFDAAGLELLAVFDRGGTDLPAGEDSPGSPSLTWVARRPA